MAARSIAIGTVALFVLWAVLDFIIHGVILSSEYAANPRAFRAMAEMNMPLMYGVTLLVALCFTMLYGLGGKRAAPAQSATWGLFYGLATGLGMGFGTYSVMPISMTMAVVWFLGAAVEAVLAALVLHWVMRPKAA